MIDLKEGDRVHYHAMDLVFTGILKANTRYGHPTEWYLKLSTGDIIVLEDLNEVYK